MMRNIALYNNSFIRLWLHLKVVFIPRRRNSRLHTWAIPLGLNAKWVLVAANRNQSATPYSEYHDNRRIPNRISTYSVLELAVLLESPSENL